jgi:hypothetical protein
MAKSFLHRIDLIWLGTGEASMGLIVDLFKLFVSSVDSKKSLPARSRRKKKIITFPISKNITRFKTNQIFTFTLLKAEN